MIGSIDEREAFSVRVRTSAPIRTRLSLAPLWLTIVLLAASALGCATTGGVRDLSGGQQSWRWYTLAFESLRADPFTNWDVVQP